MIETQNFSITYTADGSQTEWDFPYPYISGSDIKLYTVSGGVRTLISPTFYSFDTSTNKITYPLSGDPVTSGTVLYLERQTPLTQLEDSSLGNFKSNDIERMADKLTMISQEVTKAAGELYIDDEMSPTSRNAVQNRVITAQITAINSSKQDTISDLSTIRSGAAAGATALQPDTAESTYFKKTGGTVTGNIIVSKYGTSPSSIKVLDMDDAGYVIESAKDNSNNKQLHLFDDTAGAGIFLNGGDASKPYYWDGSANAYRLLHTGDTHIISTYAYDGNWYRIWSDNWCEQGGYQAVTGNGNTTQIDLLLEMSAIYTIQCSQQGYAASAQANNGIANFSSVAFTFTCGVTGNPSIFWMVSGYKAS